MKASELIALLQKLIEAHGDLVVMAEDGMDPSDPDVVEDVVLRGKDVYGRFPETCFYIRTS